MKYITGDEWLKVIGYWFMVIGLMLIAGCSSDSSGEQQTNNNQVLHITAYTTSYQDIAASRRAAPSGFTIYAPTTDFSVGLFMMSSETPTPSVQYIRRSNNTWHSSILVKGGANYEIYGFMPRFDGMTPTISKTDGTITMTLPNIDAVSAQDVCVITGVSDATANVTPVEGSFAYTGRPDVNNINVLMDHLFAAVSFNFSVDANFNNLRKIKLKKLELQATNEKVTATVTLTSNNSGASPVTTVSYSTSGTKATATFFESEAGEQLPTSDIKNSLCYFAPTLSNGGNLTLLSTYDVYDRTGTKLIRKDCQATNKVPNLYTSRGECVTVNLTVNPTYIYQLSDADLDNLFTIE